MINVCYKRVVCWKMFGEDSFLNIIKIMKDMNLVVNFIEVVEVFFFRRKFMRFIF